MRLLLTAGLVLVWAMPVVVAVDIWRWMIDYEFGVLNWLLTKLHVGDYFHHDWFANPLTRLARDHRARRLGRDPVRRDHGLRGAHAGAARARRGGVDRRRPAWRVFRDVTVPLLKPIFVILTSLSIIWDFRRLHPALDHARRRSRRLDYYADGHLRRTRTPSCRADFGLGAAISLVMVAILLVVSFVYVRQMVRIGRGWREARAGRRQRRSGTRSALVLFVVMVFPVYWMVATAFKPAGRSSPTTPVWFPLPPDDLELPDAINRPFFWDGVKNSLIVVASRSSLSMVLAFLAAVALAKFRFYGRRGVHRPDHRGPDDPADRADHPALSVVLAQANQVNKLSGRDRHLHDLRAAVLDLDAARVHARRSRRSSRRRRWSTARAASAPSSRILLPLVAPGLVATSIFAFIPAWNEYIIAYVLLHAQRSRRSRSGSRTSTARAAAPTGAPLMAGRDADRDPGGRLLPDRAAEDRVRADRRRGPRMSPGGLAPAAAACLFPGFDGLEPSRTGCGAGSPRGSAASCSSRATSRDPEQVAALTASLRAERPDLLIADRRGGRRRHAARGRERAARSRGTSRSAPSTTSS